jgi:hypothetical protein
MKTQLLFSEAQIFPKKKFVSLKSKAYVSKIFIRSLALAERKGAGLRPETLFL